MANVTVTDLLKVFNTPTGPQTVINRINFEIADRSFVSLVGPSGCGKTTLLNIIAGIESATSGTVSVGAAGQQAKLAYVFQEPRLLPWRSIFDNLMYVQKVRDEAAKERVHQALTRVGLGHAERKWPGQLSGGQQQRVGIARALSIEPDVLLMDEPFSHLDAITARGLREHLQELWAQTRKTVVFVTHDVSEAAELSDRILMLAPGGTIHEDIPVDLARPRKASNTEVAVLESSILRRFEELEASSRQPSVATSA
ncbi:ABC transporter ATP-binding protein [Mycolicibacterium poriferae]|uniref:Nitrate/sulfonate/bicarbonate ABC transporter ATP-binding protein n=3 Tax=Mycolicibacterium TaxID=1866885 RepID=A0A6N4VB89_9MYCO|nr:MULTISPECIES: ABC transporter ATP-binding protein [Mycobacteriaceae]MEC9325533.1 ABC transporter ATP-binding protein [Actinomycetota bacterium]MCV7266012.1 ABC transporter ATP-binding protein [Mycolicibacterium poriferae]MDZ5087573.1 ABC transporter ATP-binding protein [Mycolicibacterium parafortuitum]BBX51328.1 nitrate/sulfonate/bicarbonate ABC transporter ATP-binding protein [Mycolicibacterium poriferae]GFM18006.1 nitrate/sulfonate/bicarbonate ABC transporter AT Pase subunit [Mycobacteriu